jgi:hypothetical protein
MAHARHAPRPATGGPPRPPALWPWLVFSGALHAFVFLATVGVLGAGLLAGRGVEQGTGFGGDSIELEIQGPAEGPARGALPPSAATPSPAPAAAPAPAPVAPREPVTADEEVEDEPTVAVAPRPPPEPRRPEAPDPREGRGEPASAEPRPGRADTEEASALDGREEGAPGEAAEAAGTGEEATTGGAPAGEQARDLILGSAGLGGDSVTARRALLPNGGACEDPVAGTWRAQKFRPDGSTWVRFTLRVRRDGEVLSGTITSRIWTGRPSDPRPGRCTPFGFDHTWRMTARGRLEGDQMTFGATRHRLVRQDCPSTADTRYAPDHFRGTVHPMREVWDAVNNDGAFDIDEPYTFRRVSCE